MLLSCTLKDLHPLLFIQVSADVLPFKCLRGECCWVLTFVAVTVEVVLKWPKISVILFHLKNGFFGHKFPIKCIQMYVNCYQYLYSISCLLNFAG